jgi:hypothetical protein
LLPTITKNIGKIEACVIQDIKPLIYLYSVFISSITAVSILNLQPSSRKTLKSCSCLPYPAILDLRVK